MTGRSELTRRGFLLGAIAAVGLTRSAGGSECVPTPENALGPYYLPGAPFRTDLITGEEPGDRLRMSGRVLGVPGCVPLEGAILDVWQANAAGHYHGVGLSGPPKPEDFGLRGRIRTGKEGRYSFLTVMPGNYGAGAEGMRARHIHLLVSQPGYGRLVTQIYFENDPLLRTDPIADPRLAIMPRPRGRFFFEGTFDIVLRR